MLCYDVLSKRRVQSFFVTFAETQLVEFARAVGKPINFSWVSWVREEAPKP